MSQTTHSFVTVSSSDRVKQFKEILKSNQVSGLISAITFSDSGSSGNTDTENVTVEFADASKQPLHLFVKKQSSNPSHAKLLQEGQLFEKEMIFCSLYLPDAIQFCESMGSEHLTNFYPKCYYGDMGIIVFDNLVLNRNLSQKKEELHDIDQAKFVISALAKHHATAYAMIKETGGPRVFFAKYPGLDFEPFVGRACQELVHSMLENGLVTSINILKISHAKEKEAAIEKIRGMRGKMLKTVFESLMVKPRDFLVLNHGEYGSSNMMFRKDSGKILDYKVVDFQLIRYNSPNIDLAYYLFTSVKPSVRKQHFRDLLNIYLESLKSTAEVLGYPISLTIEELEKDFLQHFRYGFWFGFTICNGVATDAFKDAVGEVKDINEWAVKMNTMILKWLQDNPEVCEEKAQTIIESLEEYDNLSNGVLYS